MLRGSCGTHTHNVPYRNGAIRLALHTTCALIVCAGVRADTPSASTSVGAQEQGRSDAAEPAARAEVSARSALPSPPGDSDPLVLARYVDRVTDQQVLSLLTPDQTPQMRQLGALCARWLDAPERALPALTTLMASPDPDVAPVAARSAQAIAESLWAFELRERGVSVPFLREIIAGLGAVAASKRARADIRYRAAAAAAVLAQFVPAEPAPAPGPASDAAASGP